MKNLQKRKSILKSQVWEFRKNAFPAFAIGYLELLNYTNYFNGINVAETPGFVTETRVYATDRVLGITWILCESVPLGAYKKVSTFQPYNGAAYFPWKKLPNENFAGMLAAGYGQKKKVMGKPRTCSD